jgi:hypothetical protein
MRAGNGIRCLGHWIALALVVPAITVAQEASRNSSGASRRFPHRPQTGTSASSTVARDGGYSAGSTTGPVDESALPSVLATRFQAPAAEEVIVGDEVPEANSLPPSVNESAVETLWQPTDPATIQAGVGMDGDPDVACWPGLGPNQLSVYGGVQSSKNNSTRGADGSFGFQEGINFGTAARNIVLPSAIGLQVGFQANQANIEGASFTDNQRLQYFVTTGAFYRADQGLQGGLVFDYLWDDWNYDLQVGQVRGELSVAITNRSSFGLWFATSVTDNQVDARVFDQSVTETWESVDYYALFYRTGLLAGGRGEGQLMAGMTQDNDGIIGGKSRMPLINGWALEPEFTYMVPDEARGRGANDHESWNLAINLVWYPASLANGDCFDARRPLFDVANNGSMILQRNP